MNIHSSPSLKSSSSSALCNSYDVKKTSTTLPKALEHEIDSSGDCFAKLGVQQPLCQALVDLGYTQPSPIQMKCIPILLERKDLLGTAETGSGKTAAFSIPGIQHLDLSKAQPQMLVLAPTRELALQVSKACESYAKHLKGVYVATIYGGQSYELQRKSLRKGAQIVVATPGRLLDFIQSKSIDLSEISFVVLDEADEILRMGFVEAIDQILQSLPKKRQMALFSATMPEVIQRITHRYMNDPTEVKITSKNRAADNISQHYCFVNPAKKMQVLKRFLETEDFESAIIFVKTKGATSEVAAFLEQSGYRCAALNGDMTQALREQTLAKLRANKIHILVATDVAARGLDIDHLGLVINYDFPGELEGYVHRIGRTGRAGRLGSAILFVESGQEHGLKRLEKMLGTRIEFLKIPSAEKIKAKRFEKFVSDLEKQTFLPENKEFLAKSFELLKSRLNVDSEILSLKLLGLLQRWQPLAVREDLDLAGRSLPPRAWEGSRANSRAYSGRTDRTSRSPRIYGSEEPARRSTRASAEKMQTYRVEMGRQAGLHIKHLVGALINEGRLESHCIGNIKLFPRHTNIEISEEVSREKIRSLARIRIFNTPLNLTIVS